MAIDTKEIIKEDELLLDRLVAARQQVLNEVRKVIVGQDEVIDQTLISLFVGGHSLVTGAPGLAKTLLIRTVSNVLDLSFKRIQFTPDLMPSDITGTDIIEEDRSTGHRRLEFIQGPIFANIILADEINRTPPKTQAALLEAMQEGSVTVQGTTYTLPKPFYVLATQNPIEMEGTYPLPEAQVDRFFFKLLLQFPSRAELGRIADLTTAAAPAALHEVLDAAAILEMRQWVRDVPLADVVKDYAVRLVLFTHPRNEANEGVSALARRCVLYGSSPRGLQSLILAAKARALLAGRPNVSFEDIRTMLLPSLRHRLILNLEADAEGVTAEKILAEIVTQVAEVE